MYLLNCKCARTVLVLVLQVVEGVNEDLDRVMVKGVENRSAMPITTAMLQFVFVILSTWFTCMHVAYENMWLFVPYQT